MSKSYSKIRHMKESNIILENRLINEVETEMDDAEPTEVELNQLKSEPNYNDMKEIGAKMIDIFIANRPSTDFSDWLLANGYPRLNKKLTKLKNDDIAYGSGAITEEKKAFFGKKAMKDPKLADKVNKGYEDWKIAVAELQRKRKGL